MPRKKIFDKGFVHFSVKISRETYNTMRGELAHYNWPIIVRSLIEEEVLKLKEQKDAREKLVIEK